MDKSYIPAPAGDFVLPFDVTEAGVRGRLLRLDSVATRAIVHHALPEPAGRVLGELLTLAAMLGSLLKLDGRLTVQTKANGPLDLAVADYYGGDGEKPRGVRGFARADAAALETSGPHPDFSVLTNEGALAITIKPRRDDKAYQGVVELSPYGVAASAEIYFQQSEQLATFVRLAAAPLYLPGTSLPQWRAGGLLLQATPDAPHRDDDWERLSILAATIEDVELLDTQLSAETLLWRLFNQEEVRVLPVEEIAFRCDCSGANIAAALKSYSDEDRAGLADADGVIRAKCEFCGVVHEIDVAALEE
jgi:molecular chaperone Hsp33